VKWRRRDRWLALKRTTCAPRKQRPSGWPRTWSGRPSARQLVLEDDRPTRNDTLNSSCSAMLAQRAPPSSRSAAPQAGTLPDWIPTSSASTRSPGRPSLGTSDGSRVAPLMEKAGRSGIPSTGCGPRYNSHSLRLSRCAEGQARYPGQIHGCRVEPGASQVASTETRSAPGGADLPVLP